MHAFDPHATEIKYFQYDDNTCYFSSLDYALFDEHKHVVKYAAVSQLSSYLSCDTVGF